MPILSIRQIYSTWIRVGGNTGDIAVYMTAIAMAESGGNTTVISGSGDFGLWQINQAAHAAQFPRLFPSWDDPIANARMARIISGNGMNIGPWCTIWQIPQGNCGHYHAPPPEAGSPAGDWVHRVAAAVGSAVPPPVSHPVHVTGPPTHPGEHGWSHLQSILGDQANAWHEQIQTDREILRRI
jgi:hypothetical protein